MKSLKFAVITASLMAVLCLLAGCQKPDLSVKSIYVGSTLNLTVGETANLQVRFDPADAENQSVSWSSSDSSIASVDNSGKVTALKDGTATITVTSADGGKTATCTVTVTDPTVLKGISVTPSTLSLGVTESGELTVTYQPETAKNKKVTWKSSDTGVATVSSSGVVSAVALGTADITATSADGGYTATCKVTVKGADVYYKAADGAFLNGKSYESPNGTVSALYSDGTDLYEYITNTSEESKTGIYKNGKLLAALKNSSDGDFRLIKGNNIYFWWFKELSIYDYSKKTWVFNKALNDKVEYSIRGVTAGPDGKTYVVGSKKDSSHNSGGYVSVMWTISSDMQTVTETVLHNGSTYDYTAFSADVDSDGNVWVLSYRLGGLSNSGLKLYKNGSYVRSFNYDNNANNIHQLVCHGKDVYVFATSDDKKEMKVFKNNQSTVLYSITNTGYTFCEASKPCFSKNGDLYMPVYNMQTYKSAVYKNGQKLYDNIDQIIRYFAVLH